MVSPRLLLTLALAVPACTVASGDVLVTDPETGSSDGGIAGKPCPLPSAGRITVCGEVIDAETSAPVPNGDVLVVDPVDLDTIPTALATVTSDDDGWFFAADVPPPLGGSVALLTGEFPAATLQVAATLVSTTPGQATQGAAFVLRTQTRDGWSQSAGVVFDQALLVAIYVDIDGNSPPLAGSPVSGVQLTLGGTVETADTFYFDDAQAGSRSTFGGTVTGTSGAVVRRAPTAGQSYSGQAAGCSFAEVLTAGVNQLTQIQQIFATCQ